MRVTRMDVAAGDEGARQTVAIMRRLVRRASSHPVVRGLAVRLARPHDGRDYVAHAMAIREWAATHIRFLRDPRGTELLHSPELVIRAAEQGAAHVDCDDAAMATAALGRAIGLRARFVTIAFLDKRAPFAHVYAELSPPVGSPRWMEMDVTRMLQDIPVHVISRSFAVEV